MIHSLEHVALSVSDMERSLQFYRDFIGMEVVFEVDFDDERIGRITGMPGAKCKVVHLRLGDGTLELFQYLDPVGKRIPQKRLQCDQGFTHIGLKVTDIHRHVQELKERGIELLGELIEVRPNAWVVYFRGPDGEVCEYRQVPEKLP